MVGFACCKPADALVIFCWTSPFLLECQQWQYYISCWKLTLVAAYRTCSKMVDTHKHLWCTEFSLLSCIDGMVPLLVRCRYASQLIMALSKSDQKAVCSASYCYCWWLKFAATTEEVHQLSVLVWCCAIGSDGVTRHVLSRDGVSHVSVLAQSRHVYVLSWLRVSSRLMSHDCVLIVFLLGIAKCLFCVKALYFLLKVGH